MRLRIVPSWAVQWTAIKAQLPLQIVVLILAFTSLLLSTRNFFTALGVFVFAFGIGTLATLMYFRNVAVEVHDGGVVVVRSWIGTQRTFSITEVATSLYALEVGVTWVPPAPTLILMRPDGSALLRLRGQYWLRPDIEALIGALQITPIFVPQRVTPQHLRAVHPRAISWAEANPVALGLIVGGGLILLLIITLVVVFGLLFSGAFR